MKSRPKTLSVYGYTDYRSYLKDYYAFRKEAQRGYSFRLFSRDGGFTSPNILKLVMEGQRNLTAGSLEKFIQALQLEGQMAEYFRALVRMNQAKDDNEKSKFYEELKKLIPHAKKRELDPETMEYLSHWLYPVLREMVTTDGFRDDPYWIARKLNGRASIREITQAFNFLVKEGFIERNDKGFNTSDKMVLSSDEVRSLAIRLYHKNMLDQAKQILEDLDMSEREFGALTFTIPKDSLAELKFKLKEFRKELHLWAIQASQSAPGDSVIQVNFQMYPQTKGNGS